MRSNYHHGDLKAELIREGLLILNKEGYDGFSLRKVAKNCNVSQTAPYRHFKDKDELIAAILMQALAAFNESLEDAVQQHSDPKDGLREMGVAYVRFFTENPEYLKFLFFGGISQGVSGEADAKTKQLPMAHPFSTFYEAVKRYREAYPAYTMEQEEQVLYCWGLVHGIAALLVNDAIPYTNDPMALAEKVIRNAGFLK